jgi:Zn-dependent peptidase ImmA (M78 family)
LRKPDFARCTKEATKLLHKQDISNRILNIRNLNYDKNILFDSIQNYSDLTNTPLSRFVSSENQALRDGCTIYDNKANYYIVLYNDDIRHSKHRNWTLAHEIGHIYLGHTYDGDIEEIEAHFFASQLFMPDYTLYMTASQHRRITAEDIVEIFGVSISAAEKRIKTMNRMYGVSVYEKSHEIWLAQKERIDIYYECKRKGLEYRNVLELLLCQKKYINQPFCIDSLR